MKRKREEVSTRGMTNKKYLTALDGVDSKNGDVPQPGIPGGDPLPDLPVNKRALGNWGENIGGD